MKNKRTAFVLFLCAVLFAAAVVLTFAIHFFLLPDGEIFRWLSIDGIETWGDRYDLLTLTVLALIGSSVGTGISARQYRKKQYGNSVAVSVAVAVWTLLFLLGGLRFF